MKKMNEKREKGRKAANKRWNRGCQNDAKGMPNRYQNDALKGNKSKRNNKISDPPVLNLEEM